MISHPLLEPKNGQGERKVENLAHGFAGPIIHQHVVAPQSGRRGWLGVLAVYGLLAVLAFMLVPVITITFGDATTNFIENIKDLVNFGAPTLLIVAVLVGVTGYYGYERIAWWLSFGFWTSIAVLVINVATRVNWLNLGIFWIIVGTLTGLFFGCAFETVTALRGKHERFVIILFAIAMVASVGACFAAFQGSSKKGELVVSLTEAQQQLQYILYDPKIIPVQYSYFTPKYFVVNGEFHMYFGDDNYPPPPVLDFLKGLELIESAAPVVPPDDPLSTYVRVQVNGTDAMYRENRGRSILQWQQGGTSLLAISYSPINGKDFIEFARSIVPFTP